MNSLLPVYYQIKQNLKNSIVHGMYKAGDKIPSENELAAQFKVSRLTVRQAILQLTQEGLLVSQRGKGTFVTEDKNLISSFNLEFIGFMDDLFYQISRCKTTFVYRAKITAPSFIKEKLELLDDDSEILMVKRVRFRDGNSFAYTVNYVPLEIGSKISEEDLWKKPMLQIMEEDLGVVFTEAFQTIEASFADLEVSEKLGVASGSPILFVERIMYGPKRKPIQVVYSSYRGDLYKYIVILKNVRNKASNIWIHQPE